ncbi:hypothetical protein NP493_1402g00000 [Ridgeia piscesae]|uniref:EGF-like domain-containing protein n=1 Tax=Ridgeia piscesae TaxID=27915 RepID=A0AAD9K4C1_RIDPI|nr:hypothetical protein NP493_1402g00000 [Ridgeia piscesae]
MQRLKTWVHDRQIHLGVAVVIILCLIAVIVALVVWPTTPRPSTTEPPETRATTEKTTAASSYPPGYKYCDHNTPCLNGGTCVDLPDSKYLCVCTKCNCSSEKPYGNCEINETTICKRKELPPLNLVPHPYRCNKFYNCNPDFTSEREQDVWHHEDHVFNPKNDTSDWPQNVKCAVTICKYYFNFPLY